MTERTCKSNKSKGDLVPQSWASGSGVLYTIESIVCFYNLSRKIFFIVLGKYTFFRYVFAPPPLKIMPFPEKKSADMGVRRGGQGGLLAPPWPAKNSMFLDFLGEK